MPWKLGATRQISEQLSRLSTYWVYSNCIRHCISKSRLMGFNVDNYFSPIQWHSQYWKNNMLLHTHTHRQTHALHPIQYMHTTHSFQLPSHYIRLECLFSPCLFITRTQPHKQARRDWENHSAFGYWCICRIKQNAHRYNHDDDNDDRE